MLNAYIVRFSVTTAFFFFHLCRTLDALLKLACDQHNKEQKESFEKKNFIMTNALTFFFLI